MTTVEFFDAAFIPATLPNVQGFFFYLPGGDPEHPWTATDIARARRQYEYACPIFVRSNPKAFDGHSDASIAIANARHTGFSGGALALDIETAVDPSYTVAFGAALKAAGYTLLLYGSESTVFDNPAPFYWAANFDATAPIKGAVATQFKNEPKLGQDLSWVDVVFANAHMYPKVPVTPPEVTMSLAAPAAVSDTPYQSVVDLGWNAVVEYHYQVRNKATGTVVADVTNPATHARVTGLAPTTEYEWRVSAKPSGEWTDWKSFTTNNNPDPVL